MEKHHGCVNTKVIIDYFQEYFPDLVPDLLQDLHPEIDRLDNPQEFLSDSNNWVSSEVVIALFKNARRLSQDEQIARKIGKYAATHQKFGYVQRILVHFFGTPRHALRRLQTISDKFNRNKSVEVLFTGKRQAIIRFRYFRHIPSEVDFCLFNQGILEAMPTIWQLPPGHLVESRCYFRGDEYCEYQCAWEERAVVRKWLRRLFLPWRLLRDTIQELERDKDLLKKKYDEVHHLNLQLKERIDQLMTLPETCMAALTAVDVRGLLQVTLSFLVRFVKLDRAGVFLLNEETKHLEIHCGVGIEPQLYDKVKDYQIPVTKIDNVVARVAINGIPLVINDVAHSRINKDNPLIRLFQPKAFILAPIAVRGKVIGVILADRIHQDPKITEVDKEMVMNFAHQIAMALDSAFLHRKLEVSERRYQELVENAYEGIWIIDEQGTIKFANQRLREISGEPHPEGKDIFTFFGRENRKILANILAQNKKGQVAQQELELLTPAQEAVAVIMSSVPIIEANRYVGAFAMLNDITALKKMERQLLQQQQLQAMATLAEGWARNFNDILVNIMILTGFLLAETPEGTPAYADLKQIEQEVSRGADFIEQLLSMGRRRFSPKPLDLNLLIDKVVKIFRFSYKNLRIQRQLAPTLPPAEVDASHMEQVLVNLLLMVRPQGGKAREVIISTEETVLTEEFCQPYGRLPGPYLYISVHAPALVLDEGLKDKIFEPFVMTDDLGLEVRPSLASVYSIIKNHHGIIELDSEASFGTTFHLYLPVSKRAIAPPESQPWRFVRGSGTILLVDDEEQVRAIGARILERLGYKVLQAANGPQAYDIIKAGKEPIDLVVLDMVLPGWSGRETFQRLQELDPQIKVLLYSAHSIDEDVHLMLEKGALGFLRKPARLATLSQKIAGIIGNRPMAAEAGRLLDPDDEGRGRLTGVVL